MGLYFARSVPGVVVYIQVGERNRIVELRAVCYCMAALTVAKADPTCGRQIGAFKRRHRRCGEARV